MRKGAYYLAHIAYLKRQGQIDKLVIETAVLERKVSVAREFIEAVTKLGKEAFDDAKKTFKMGLAAYMKKEGANEDAALKNSSFSDQIDKSARSAMP